MIITEPAKKKIAELIESTKVTMPNESFFLRVTVVPGGCSGLKHQIYFDYEIRSDDELINYEEFDLRIDQESYKYLDGATIDHFDTIEKQGFFIDNPNATGTCACGDSFH